MRHLLRKPDGATLLIDADLWIAVLDLALLNGWHITIRPEVEPH